MRILALLLMISACQVQPPELMPDWVVDGPGKLTIEEEDLLFQKLQDFNHDTGVEMALIIVESVPDERSVGSYAEELLIRWEVGLPNVYNGVLVLVSMTERQIYLARGEGLHWNIPEDDVDTITEAVGEYLGQDEYFRGMDTAIDEVSRRVEGVTWDIVHYDLSSAQEAGQPGEVVAFEATVQSVSGDTVVVKDDQNVVAKVLLLPGTTPMVMEDIWFIHARVMVQTPLELQLLGLEAAGVMEQLL